MNPPMAANAPWHSEIWPANPVITVIDRKIVDEDHRLRDEEQPRLVGLHEHDVADDGEEAHGEDPGRPA